MVLPRKIFQPRRQKAMVDAEADSDIRLAAATEAVHLAVSWKHPGSFGHRLMGLQDTLKWLTELSKLVEDHEAASEMLRALYVVDARSYLDNLFQDLPTSKYGPQDDSVLTRFSNDNHKGAASLGAFARDMELEDDLTNVRNKVCAHLDPDIPLTDLQKLLRDFNYLGLDSYVKSIYLEFRTALSKETTTMPFLLHGHTLKGITMVPNSLEEPFSEKS